MKLDKLSKKLAKGLEYYTSKPERRSVAGTHCFYDGSKKRGVRTKGCFVGQFLTPENRKKADECGAFNSPNLIELMRAEPELLPKWIRDNSEIVRRFQLLHDGSSYWNEEGLSPEGGALLLDIIIDGDLDKRDFDKSLTNELYPSILQGVYDALIEKLQSKYQVVLDPLKPYATNKHLQLYVKSSGGWVGATIPKENLIDGGFHK